MHATEVLGINHHKKFKVPRFTDFNQKRLSAVHKCFRRRLAVRGYSTSQCIADVAEWLSANCLCLNPDKTVIMWQGSKHQTEKVAVHDIPVLQSSMTTVDTARDIE